MTKPDKTTQLTPKMKRAALLLGSGKRPGQVAESVGISRSQLYQWLRDEAFNAEVQAELNLQLDQARTVLIAGAVAAVEQLIKLMESAESESVRLRAALAVISQLQLDRLIESGSIRTSLLPKSVDGFLNHLGWADVG